MKITKENGVIKLRLKGGTVIELPRLNLTALFTKNGDQRLFQRAGRTDSSVSRRLAPPPRR